LSYERAPGDQPCYCESAWLTAVLLALIISDD
jgi:hypothetical protein